jgi:hypothetical protein
MEPAERQYEEILDEAQLQRVLSNYQEDYNASGTGTLSLGERCEACCAVKRCLAHASHLLLGALSGKENLPYRSR